MEIIETVDLLRQTIKTIKANKQRIAFVPTMGNLHEGHLALVRQAKKYAEVVVVSIFVNPIQFGANEDFHKYPRTLNQDCASLARLGVDIVFTPKVEQMYPTPQKYFVEVPELASELCGEFRPGHFKGVATVVLKLFNLVQPDYAIFGKKDYQQLAIIRGMIANLNLPIQVVGAETIRAEDGVALSSRNGYLTPEQRELAPALHQSLVHIRSAIQKGHENIEALIEEDKAKLIELGFKIDYISVRNQADLSPATEKSSDLVILLAVWLGTTRLIDNVELYIV